MNLIVNAHYCVPYMLQMSFANFQIYYVQNPDNKDTKSQDRKYQSTNVKIFPFSSSASKVNNISISELHSISFSSYSIEKIDIDVS